MHRALPFKRCITQQWGKACGFGPLWSRPSTMSTFVASVNHRARSSGLVWAAVTAGITSLAMIEKRRSVLCADLHWASSVSCLSAGQTVKQGGLSEEDPIENRTLVIRGMDRRGRPMLVARPSLHVATSKKESLEAVAACMQTVRRAVTALPVGESQVLILYDLGGAGYRNFDMTFSRQLIDGLVQEFPDCLDKILVINGHWSMSAAWSAIEKLLHHETRRKVTFCRKDYRKELFELVDADHTYLRKLEA